MSDLVLAARGTVLTVKPTCFSPNVVLDLVRRSLRMRHPQAHSSRKLDGFVKFYSERADIFTCGIGFLGRLREAFTREGLSHELVFDGATPLGVPSADNARCRSLSHLPLYRQAADLQRDYEIDVNGTEAYKQGHIPGAIDFISNRADIASKLPSDKDALIVAYCVSEGCSAYALAAKAAIHLGYNNVKRFAPGLAGWKAAGEPLQKGQ